MERSCPGLKSHPPTELPCRVSWLFLQFLAKLIRLYSWETQTWLCYKCDPRAYYQTLCKCCYSFYVILFINISFLGLCSCDLGEHLHNHLKASYYPSEESCLINDVFRVYSSLRSNFSCPWTAQITWYNFLTQCSFYVWLLLRLFAFCL